MTARAWILLAAGGCIALALIARETQSLRSMGLLAAVVGLVLLVGGLAMGNRYQPKDPPA